MTSEPWQIVGVIASTAGVTSIGIGAAKGIQASYQTYASPYTSLTDGERRLEMVRSELQRLSPKRREEIEIATRRGDNVSSLEALERQLEDLTDMHRRLSKGIDKTTFTERHSPFSEFRHHLSRFEEHVKALLNDTLKTTVPCVDELAFKPENSRRPMERPSSSESSSKPENSGRATERPSSSESTNPKISRRDMESSSSSKSTYNSEISRWAMKGSSSSESTRSFRTARESFSDLGDIPLSPGRMV